VIRQLSGFIVGTSVSFPRFVLAALLGPATLFLVLFPMMRAFSALTGGVPPFDWQNALTAADIADQLPLYAGAARDLYFAHVFVDTIFPVFVGTFFGAIAAFVLRHGTPRLYERAVGLGLFAAYFISVPFDYCENLGGLAAIMAYPAPPGGWASLVIFGKSVKLVTEFVIPGSTAAALVIGAVGWLWARLRGG
jgi:hypothetical protein